MKNFWDSLDETIRRMQAAWEMPAVSVAVVKDDQVVYARGFGVLAHGKPEPADEHSVFAIGSCTKAFTATAIGMLVQEGRLSWEDPVIRHLPGFKLFDPLATREITVRDLLCHRCGLATFSGDFMGYGSSYTRQEVMERMRFIPPAFQLRAGFGYTNLMFMAAGEVIQAVSGQTWEEFIRRRLIEPLGMTRTTTDVLALKGMDNVAQPHALEKGQLRQVPYTRLVAHAAAGAINSSAWDMASWLRFQLSMGKLGDEQWIDPAILEETRTPHTLLPIDAENLRLVPRRHFAVYGLGWALNDYAGRLVVQHTGGVDGMLSVTGFLPEEGVGWVILTNRMPASLYSALFFHLLDAALGIEGKDWQSAYLEQDRVKLEKAAEARRKLEGERRVDSRPSLPLEDYSGSYTNPIYGELTVSLEAGRLVLHPGAHPELSGPLEHWHADTFSCTWSNPTYEESFVHFSVGMHGKAETLRFKVAEFIDPLEYVFRRVE